MARKAKPKTTDTVLESLEMLKDNIEALEEILDRKDFDEYDAGDAWECCEQIEELALAIKKGVETK